MCLGSDIPLPCAGVIPFRFRVVFVIIITNLTDILSDVNSSEYAALRQAVRDAVSRTFGAVFQLLDFRDLTDVDINTLSAIHGF